MNGVQVILLQIFMTFFRVRPGSKLISWIQIRQNILGSESGTLIFREFCYCKYIGTHRLTQM